MVETTEMLEALDGVVAHDGPDRGRGVPAFVDIFPPLVMGIVKSATGGYALGFILMALVAVACLIVLGALRGPQPAAPSRRTVPRTADP